MPLRDAGIRREFKLRHPALHPPPSQLGRKSLWLGHESIETTQIYIHADLAMKEKAINRTTPLGVVPGRYRPPDALLAFLEAL